MTVGTSDRSFVMRPLIDGTEFGSITLDGVAYEHDVIVGGHGKVRRRKKKLSKAVYGTSHIVSLAEAEDLYGRGEGAGCVIVGAGQYGRLDLSPEAAAFFAQKHCDVVLLPTPQAIEVWNEVEGDVIGLFHVTC